MEISTLQREPCRVRHSRSVANERTQSPVTYSVHLKGEVDVQQRPNVPSVTTETKAELIRLCLSDLMIITTYVRMCICNLIIVRCGIVVKQIL